MNQSPTEREIVEEFNKRLPGWNAGVVEDYNHGHPRWLVIAHNDFADFASEAFGTADELLAAVRSLPLPAEPPEHLPKITVELPVGDSRKVTNWFTSKTDDGWNVCVTVSEDRTTLRELAKLLERMDDRIAGHDAECGVYYDSDCSCGYADLSANIATIRTQHPELFNTGNAGEVEDEQ